MEKNENGYPINTCRGLGGAGTNASDVGDRCGSCAKRTTSTPTFCSGGNGGANGNGNGGANGNGNGALGGNSNGNSGANGNMNHSCGGRGDCLDLLPLAYVYAPDQPFRMLYTAEDALGHGTLFEELYKPMEVYGRE